MKKTLSVLSLIIILLTTSCRKLSVHPDDSANGSNSSNPLVGTWKIIASTSKIDFGGQVLDVDLYSMFTACALDNTVTYNANFSCTSDEGPTKCDPSTPQTQTGGKWTLSPDKKSLKLEFPPVMGMESLTAEVLQLDDRIFKIKYVTYINGPEATTTTTYTRVK